MTDTNAKRQIRGFFTACLPLGGYLPIETTIAPERGFLDG